MVRSNRGREWSILHSREPFPKTWHLLCLRLRCAHRFGELRIIHRDILFHFFRLNREASAWPGQSPAERNLYAVEVTIVGIVNLRGHKPERSLPITNEPQQQSRLRIEIQA